MDERALQNLPLFESLGRKELHRIAALADEVEMREGEELLHQGNFAHEFMVVIEGKAEVTRDGEAVADVGPGDVLGEIAALDRGQRSATIIASSPMRVLVMTDRDLRQIAREMPEVDSRLREAAREHSPLSAG